MSTPNPATTNREALTVHRTPNPICPGCAKSRLHTKEETALFHPLSGNGYAKEIGWSHPDLEPRK